MVKERGGEIMGIEMFWENEGCTYYKFSGEDKRIIKFDNIYTKWMNALYQLVIHIEKERDKRLIDSNKMENDSKYQFFGLAESVANQLMYFLVKDELSESNSNKELDSLCYHMYFNKESYSCVNEFEYIYIKRYLEKLVTQDFNTFIVGQFYDFYVSYWSCFEACINIICKPYEEKIRENLNTSQFEEMKKFLNKLYDDQSEYQEIITKFDKEKFSKKFGKYVSFPDKYTYLMKNIIGNEYKRDEKNDRKFLEFCGAFRNTVHNNGTHLKADKKIEIKGEIFSLKKGEKLFSNDFSKIFILAEELFDIYIAIIDGLDALKKRYPGSDSAPS